MNIGSLPPNNKLVLAALAGSILLASLGISITTVALPTLATAFSATVQQVQWVVLAYLLSLTVFIVSAGRMGDLYGSRSVLISGLVLFSLASIVCAAAPNLGWLIAGRVAQGLAAAVLMSLPMSLAKGLVAKERMGAAMGLLGTMSAIGTALGPSLGGGLINQLGWRSVFVLLLLFGLGMLVIALIGIPKENRQADTTVRMDWAGSLWLCLALLFFSLSATGGKAGMAIPVWMLLVAANIALAAFVGVEMRAAHPLVSLALLGRRTLATSLTMNLIVSAIMMSTLVVGPFYLSFGLGLSELAMGMVMAAGPAAAALSGVPAGRITDHFGTDRTLLAGLMLSTGGLICFALLPGRVGIRGYLMALVLITPGFQLFLAANNTATMAEAADAQRGTVAGLLGLSRNLGFMTGASLMPLLFASLLGNKGVALSSPQVVGEAFSRTFLCAAALFVFAIVVFFLGKAHPQPLSSSSSHQVIKEEIMTDTSSLPQSVATQAVGTPLPAYLSGQFHLVSTGIGDAGNITVNAREVLRRADVVFGIPRLLETFSDLLKGKELHDPGHGLFMDLIRKDTPAEKADAMEAEVRRIVRNAAVEGKRVAVMDYGDSMIFGPQAGFLKEFSHLNPVVIPGVSSFNAANAALARDVMTGSTSRSVILAAAFDACDDYAGTDTLSRLAQTGSTLVFFAMRSQFEQLVERLRGVLPGFTPLAVVCHAGRSDKHTLMRATLDTAIAAVQGREVPFEHLVYVGDFLAD